MGNNPKSISHLISIYSKPKSLYMVRDITINGIGCTVRILDNASFRESPGVPLGAKNYYIRLCIKVLLFIYFARPATTPQLRVQALNPGSPLTEIWSLEGSPCW